MKEQPADDVTDLLIRFCRSELVPDQERRLLYEAALNQEVFDHLMEMEALRDALLSPTQRLRLHSAFQSRQDISSLEVQITGSQSLSKTWGIQYVCPDVDTMCKAVNNTAGFERETVTRHIADEKCIRCGAIFQFLSTRPDSRDGWLDAVGGIIESVDPVGYGDLRVRQPLNPFGIRVSCEQRGSRVTLMITSLNPAHATHDTELWILSNNLLRLTATMHSTEEGTLKANIVLNSIQDLIEKDACLPFILRIREAKSLRQKKARISNMVRSWLSGGGRQLGSIEPNLAMIGSGQEEPTSVVGIVCEVKDSLLLIQLAPETIITIGESLKLIRNESFIGLAIVIGIDEFGATSRFHSAGSEVPLAGDLALNATED